MLSERGKMCVARLAALSRVLQYNRIEVGYGSASRLIEDVGRKESFKMLWQVAGRFVI